MHETLEVDSPFQENAYANSPEVASDEREQYSEYMLPSLELFPPRVRRIIDKAHHKAVAHFDQAQEIVSHKQKIWVILENLKHLETEEALADSAVSDGVKIHMAEQEQTLNMLLTVNTQLEQGKDVFDLLEQVKERLGGFFFETVTQQEREKYGQTNGLLQRLSQMRTRLTNQSDYQERKQQYLAKLKRNFEYVLEAFLNSLIIPLPAVFSELHNELDALMRSTSLPPAEAERVQEKVSNSFRDAFSQIKEGTQILQSYIQLLKLAQQTQSNSSSNEQYAQTLINNSLQALERMRRERQQQLEGFFEIIEKAKKRVVLSALSHMSEQFSLMHKSYSIDNTPRENIHWQENWIPQEAVTLQERFKKLSVEIQDFASGYTSDVDFISQILSIQFQLDSFQSRLENISLRNQELVTSSTLLWHVARFETVTDGILTSGFLGSRSYQLDHMPNGEAQFHTAGRVRITKDSVVIPTLYGERTIPLTDYQDMTVRPGNIGKDLFQESHQVCFTEGEPYYGFTDNIALLFDRATIYSRGQFMVGDGIHLFDENYTTNRSDAPGFHVDLKNSPFVVLVDESKKTDFLDFLEHMFDTAPQWQDLKLQKESWISLHVLFTPNLNNKIIARETNKEAQELLKKQGLVSCQPGYFLPSGERGETAGRSWVPLYMYRTTQQLESLPKTEPISFESDKLNALLEQESIDFDALFEILNANPTLEELLAEGTGVSERYSLAKHIRMVLEQFEKYFARNVSPETRLFFRKLILFHDLGKPDSLRETGHTKAQHEYTLELMEPLWASLRFSEQEKNLAVALIDQDYIGNHMKQISSFDDTPETALKIHNVALKLGVPLATLFEMMKIFYMVDAGSYTKDANGIRSLDHLFDFDPVNKTIRFSQHGSVRAMFTGTETPEAHFALLETAIRQLSS